LLFACTLSPVPVCAEGDGLARDQSRPFRVDFTSLTPCRDSGEFVRELLSLAPRARPASATEPAFLFGVELMPVGAGVQGQLFVRGPEGSFSSRPVPGGDCHEVLRAMALIAALVVDPPSTPKAHAGIERVWSNAAADAGTQPAERSEPSLPAWRFAVGQRLTAHTALAPELMFGLSAHGELTYAVDDVFQPMLRLAAHFAPGGTVERARGDAEFEWLAARGSLCPVRLSPESYISFVPCAFIDAGRLSAAGRRIDEPREESVFWSATGAVLSLDVNPTGLLTLGGEAGLLLPFSRNRFFFVPDEAPEDTVHRIPAAGLTLAVGAGLRFF
jgi:hypothetical protein